MIFLIFGISNLHIIWIQNKGDIQELKGGSPIFIEIRDGYSEFKQLSVVIILASSLCMEILFWEHAEKL